MPCAGVGREEENQSRGQEAAYGKQYKEGSFRVSYKFTHALSFLCHTKLFFVARAIVMLFADTKFAEDTVQQVFTGGLACDFAQGIIGSP